MKLKPKKQSRNEQSQPDQTLPSMLLAGQADIQSRWPIVLLAAFTWVLSLPLFAPWSFWPVGYVVFVPWLVAMAVAGRSRWLYVVSYLLGAAFYLLHFRWLSETTIEGYVLCSLLYLAPLFSLVAWGTRHLHRERGLSLAVAFPLMWTLQELIHSRGPLAFPWFLLGHSQVRFLSMIQIADLVGVYGVSLVVAAVNGWLADLALRTFKKKRRQPVTDVRKFRLATGFALGLWAIAFLYGQFRLYQGGQIEGPRVSVLQGDFPLFTFDNPTAATDEDKRKAYMELAQSALADSPDIIVFPETPWSAYLNWDTIRAGRELSDRQTLIRMADEQEVYLVVGGMTWDPQPPGSYPKAHRFNSAFVFKPDGGSPDRYDKINLVLFGEYVPFRYAFPPLYRFLNSGPWIPAAWRDDDFEYSLTPGGEYKVFPIQAKSKPGRSFGFGVTICYEDVVPQVFRRFILDEHGAKKADFMLNISNDGWFGYSTQQAQHLVNCAFRAVENRVGIARSVNTGISGFVRPDGSWYDLVQEEGRRLHAGGSGHRTAGVWLDPRITFYSRFGDLLPVGWSLIAAVGIIDAGRVGWKRWREGRRAKRGKRRGAK
ncbi:MAG TPA: apolipoprotein N-acyltransferase [Phycisphaerae bacterium]|nr:apolipoprotein N-acyltransferase [Phycisphaerae bacterium]HPU31486.1 apolipoprotein N-acyltransferase [Phycisphaerae bacterium]HQE42427.1 apolipoprotein N-acyltransferase [Phycisphaerae bacterium]HXK84608.1 apolipoprotein N-acyltransferase [Phycisphaerae bacterium]